MKPCPFCGIENVTVERYDSVAQTTVYVATCRYCNSQGPARGTRDEAGKAWDNRPEGKNE